MTTTLAWREETKAKLMSLVERRNGFIDQTADAYLRNSEEEPKDTRAQFALGRWLGVRETESISVRRVWINANTTAYLICVCDTVVEVITYTGYRRTVQTRWRYVGGLDPDGGRDGERFHAAMKMKRPKQVGGGLMRGKASPRTKKLKILSTHALRRVSGEV
jgi:hypothetical protein